MRAQVLLIVIFLLSYSPELLSCTVVCVSAEKDILVGINEDASPRFPTRAIFRQAEGGQNGYVIFGFADGWPQSGMNDKGLLVGWAAGYSTDWKQDPQKANYWDNLTIKIMTECTSVQEALTVLTTFNNPDLAYARMLLADRNGESVIVWYKGSVQITRSTQKCQALGFGEQQAVQWFQRTKTYNADVVRSIMSDCMQNRRDAITLYSLVCDLKSGDIHVFNVYKGRGIFRTRRVSGNVILNLYDELARDNHYFDLPLLSTQSPENGNTDVTTFSPVSSSVEIQSRVCGIYTSESGIQIDIHMDRDRLIMAHSGLPGRTCQLFQNSMRVFNFSVELPESKSTPVAAVMFYWITRRGEKRSEKGTRMF